MTLSLLRTAKPAILRRFSDGDRLEDYLIGMQNGSGVFGHETERRRMIKVYSAFIWHPTTTDGFKNWMSWLGNRRRQIAKGKRMEAWVPVRHFD